jgi:hypothetical protein
MVKCLFSNDFTILDHTLVLRLIQLEIDLKSRWDMAIRATQPHGKSQVRMREFCASEHKFM